MVPSHRAGRWAALVTAALLVVAPSAEAQQAPTHGPEVRVTVRWIDGAVTDATLQDRAGSMLHLDLFGPGRSGAALRTLAEVDLLAFGGPQRLERTPTWKRFHLVDGSVLAGWTSTVGAVLLVEGGPSGPVCLPPAAVASVSSDPAAARLLHTDPEGAPAAARYARLRLVLEPVSARCVDGPTSSPSPARFGAERLVHLGAFPNQPLEAIELVALAGSPELRECFDRAARRSDREATAAQVFAVPAFGATGALTVYTVVTLFAGLARIPPPPEPALALLGAGTAAGIPALALWDQSRQTSRRIGSWRLDRSIAPGDVEWMVDHYNADLADALALPAPESVLPPAGGPGAAGSAGATAPSAWPSVPEPPAPPATGPPVTRGRHASMRTIDGTITTGRLYGRSGSTLHFEPEPVRAGVTVGRSLGDVDLLALGGPPGVEVRPALQRIVLTDGSELSGRVERVGAEVWLLSGEHGATCVPVSAVAEVVDDLGAEQARYDGADLSAEARFARARLVVAPGTPHCRPPRGESEPWPAAWRGGVRIHLGAWPNRPLDARELVALAAGDRLRRQLATRQVEGQRIAVVGAVLAITGAALMQTTVSVTGGRTRGVDEPVFGVGVALAATGGTVLISSAASITPTRGAEVGLALGRDTVESIVADYNEALAAALGLGEH